MPVPFTTCPFEVIAADNAGQNPVSCTPAARSPHAPHRHEPRPAVWRGGRHPFLPISAAENYAAETIKRKCEIYRADYGHRDHLLPNNGQACAAIEHILCEHNKMRRWA